MSYSAVPPCQRLGTWFLVLFSEHCILTHLQQEIAATEGLLYRHLEYGLWIMDFCFYDLMLYSFLDKWIIASWILDFGLWIIVLVFS